MFVSILLVYLLNLCLELIIVLCYRLIGLLRLFCFNLPFFPIFFSIAASVDHASGGVRAAERGNERAVQGVRVAARQAQARRLADAGDRQVARRKALDDHRRLARRDDRRLAQRRRALARGRV